MTQPIAPAAASTAAAARPANDNAAKLKSAAQAFEAVFLRQMIGSMRAASLDDGMFDSSATEQFRDMSDSRLADDMAGKGAIGVAQLLLTQFSGTLKSSAAEPSTGTKGGAQ